MTAIVALVLALSAQAAPVRLAIESTEKVLRPGQRMALRFTIENAGAQEAKVDEPESYLEGLEILDADGKVLRPVGKTKGITKRTVPLEAGGFVGRVVDIAPAFPEVAPDREGWHRIRWSFGDAVSNEIRVYVMRDWIANLETNHGAIEMELHPHLAPNHVQNFLKLARSGFYEGSTFHRIIPGFMMQGGIPKDPANEIKTPLNAEFSSTKHVFGTVSMARTANPNSATSQFFICFGGVPQLDGNYTVFGQLVSGEEVVKTIERVKTDHSPCKKCGRVVRGPGATPCCGAHHEDRPEQDVVIKKVTVSERKT
jgi:cyclophilin family peptidyl-prolyl cis-trans isomerase